MLHCIKTRVRSAAATSRSSRVVWTFAMNARTANTQYTFDLPSLSYIDASWEEPDRGISAESGRSARKAGLARWLAGRVEAIRTWHRSVRASSELEMMSDRQLMDIGISR